MIELDDHLRRLFPRERAFDAIMSLPGRVHRIHKNRRTIEVELGGRRYFVKTHRGAGWGEILKNLLHGRKPVLTARDEWLAAQRLRELGVPTVRVVGCGARGRNPARMESFIITEALDGMIDLRELSRDWGGLRGVRLDLLRRRMLRQIARMARTLHGNGINHRDFYLAHFLVHDRTWPDWRPGDDATLHLIDLHRAQMRRRTPRTAAVKDIAALLFSAMDAGLTQRDWLRFLAEYRGESPRDAAINGASFGRAVLRRAVRLYRAEHGRQPRLPGDRASSA